MTLASESLASEAADSKACFLGARRAPSLRSPRSVCMFLASAWKSCLMLARTLFTTSWNASVLSLLGVTSAAAGPLLLTLGGKPIPSQDARGFSLSPLRDSVGASLPSCRTPAALPSHSPCFSFSLLSLCFLTASKRHEDQIIWD